MTWTKAFALVAGSALLSFLRTQIHGRIISKSHLYHLSTEKLLGSCCHQVERILLPTNPIRVLCSKTSQKSHPCLQHELGSHVLQELCLCLLLANRAHLIKDSHQKAVFDYIFLHLQMFFKLCQVIYGNFCHTLEHHL